MRQQLGPFLIAALFGAAATAACLQPPPDSASASTADPAIAVPRLPNLPRTFAPPASVHGDAPAGASVDQGVMTTTPSHPGDLPPARALEAYQRATTVMAEADPGCGLSWPLLAAIGSIESDHGRIDGTVLGADGVADPPILGPPLDGAGATARILDTDHGSVDGDVTVDRAVGPLQLIPSTWAAVAVDGDSDGVRNPQDIDDASLAAAVYLCAWHDDLTTDAGRRSAVFRYNRSWSYVARVLQTMQQYAGVFAGELADDLVAALVPTSTAAPVETEIVPAGEPADPGPGDVWTLQGGAVWFVSPITQWVLGPSPGTTQPAPTPAPTPEPVLAAPPLPMATLAPTTAPTGPPTEPPTEPPTDTATPSAPADALPTSTPASGDEATGSPGPALSPSSSAPAVPELTDGTSPHAGPASDGASPAPSAPPVLPEEVPVGLSAAEAEAWSACIVIVTVDSVTTQGECLASALGLPLDDPRVVWLLLQVPGREDQ